MKNDNLCMPIRGQEILLQSYLFHFAELKFYFNVHLKRSYKLFTKNYGNFSVLTNMQK